MKISQIMVCCSLITFYIMNVSEVEFSVKIFVPMDELLAITSCRKCFEPLIFVHYYMHKKF